jgi:hypothetical protein
MSDRLRAMNDAELGDALSGMGSHIRWPATPAVARSVGETIRGLETRPSLVASRLSVPSRRRTLIAVAAVLLLLAGAALATKLVIELGAVAIEVLPGRPDALPSTVVTDVPLGREVPLARAAEIAGFPAALPSGVPAPARIWVDEAIVDFESEVVGRRIVSAWPPTSTLPRIEGTDVGAVLMQFEGPWQVASKLLSEETNDYGMARVSGRQAFWTTGAHELLLLTDAGSQRLFVTGNVLIWQAGGFTFRLETALAERAAIRIAETISPSDDPG